MATTVKINYNGSDYTLAMNRRTVNSLSENGFTITAFGADPAVKLPQLFAGAFLRYHPNMKRKDIDEIWKKIPNKDDFSDLLVQMYTECLNEIFDEPDEEDEKKAMWEVVSK